MWTPVSLDPARHPGELTAAAARALAAGRFAEAHALADRRCRIRPPASAHDHLLCAAARRGLGDPEGAAEDVRIAAEIDPGDRLVARALLASQEPAERRRGARALLSVEIEPRRLAGAIEVLLAAGAAAAGAFRSGPDGLHGWAVWREGVPLRLTLGLDEVDEHLQLAPDPDHPLARPGCSAAALRRAWPAGVETVTINAKVLEGRAEIVGSAFSRPRRPAPVILRAVPEAAPGARHVHVILPVYDDLTATAACLDSLRDARAHPAEPSFAVVAIDDATPDPAIAALLDARAAAGEVALIRNRANLGFARSVNRALAGLPPGDVLILNADTIVPPGAIQRLARAAHSAPDIGTVTPLSNNGENTSLPGRFVENQLPGPDEVAGIDRAAAALHSGVTVEMPNGTGFCLYLRRDCLDAIGPFGTEFGRGYLEDVDLCLRAGLAGFRNVCAADIYVGHAGSRSFGTEKRGLVVQNLAAIEARYPGYERACAAFFAADPLAAICAAVVERAGLKGGASFEAELRSAPPGGSLAKGEPRSTHDRPLTLLSPGTDIASFVRLREIVRGLAQHRKHGRAASPLPEGTPTAFPAPCGEGSARHVERDDPLTERDDLPPFIILGATFDDLRLMASGPAWVTGAVAPDEVASLLGRLVGRLVELPPAAPADPAAA